MYEWIMVFFAQYLYIIIALIAAGFFLVKRKAISLGVAVKVSFVAFVFALLIDKVLNKIIYSPRPFVLENIPPLISHAADNGFPSEHTLFVFLIAGIVFVFNRTLGIILAILALGVGVGSVFVRVHHPVDVLGGISIAFFAVLVSWYFVFKSQKRFSPPGI